MMKTLENGICVCVTLDIWCYNFLNNYISGGEYRLVLIPLQNKTQLNVCNFCVTHDANNDIKLK